MRRPALALLAAGTGWALLVAPMLALAWQTLAPPARPDPGSPPVADAGRASPVHEDTPAEAAVTTPSADAASTPSRAHTIATPRFPLDSTSPVRRTEFHPVLESAEFVPGLRVRPGDVFSYALDFVNRGTRPDDRQEAVFVHIEREGDCTKLAFQLDHDLRLLTDMWMPGERVLDGPRLAGVPLETPPGEYEIHVGLFDRDGDGSRSFDARIGTLAVDPEAPPTANWRPEPLPEAELARRRAALRTRLLDPVWLRDEDWSFALDRASGAFLLVDTRSGVVWSSDPDSTRLGRVRFRCGKRSIDLALERFGRIEARGEGLVAHAALGRGGEEGGSVDLVFERSPQTRGLRVSAQAHPPPGFELETLTLFERAFTTTDADDGALIAPNWLGQLKPAGAGLPCERWYGGDDVAMAMSGALKQGSALLVAWLDPDASLILHAALEDAPLCAGRRAQSLSLVLGPRSSVVELVPLGPGGYPEIGRAYREIAELRGLRRTWSEKKRGEPRLELLEGAPEFRFSGLSRVVPATRHNQGARTIAHVDWTFDEVARCARHWHDELGIERAQILVAGWGREGYDNGFPDVLPSNPECGGDLALASTSCAVQELGYAFTLHDNYVDLYPDAPSWDPERIVRGEAGELRQGGEWLGGRAYRICGVEQLRFARRNLPAIAALFHPQAIFLDSTLTSHLQTCSHPAHPMQWWQDEEQRLELFRYARSAIGPVGLEGGREWAVPDADWFEGMLTQKTVHVRDWIIAPIFLFAYGDCVQLLPMQADKLRPRDARKLLDLMLCGAMPSYAFGAHAYFESVPAGALPVVPEVARFESRGTDELRLLLEWKVNGAVRDDCRVFVHFTRPGVKNREGIAFQGDHDPKLPTSQWKAGEPQRTGGTWFRIPREENEYERWEVRVGLARDGERLPLDVPDADDGMCTVGVLRREEGRLVFESAARTAESCFARADGGWAAGLLSTDRMIKNSYEVLTWLNRLALASGLSDHAFLTSDRSVERSRFGATTVTVNFGAREWVAGDTHLPQFGFLIESPGFVAFHATRRGALEYPGGALFTLRALDAPDFAHASTVRVFHGFGDAHVEIGGRVLEVAREARVDARAPPR